MRRQCVGKWQGSLQGRQHSRLQARAHACEHGCGGRQPGSLQQLGAAPMIKPSTICATSGVWVRGEILARKGGSSLRGRVSGERGHAMGRGRAEAARALGRWQEQGKGPLPLSTARSPVAGGGHDDTRGGEQADSQGSDDPHERGHRQDILHPLEACSGDGMRRMHEWVGSAAPPHNTPSPAGPPRLDNALARLEARLASKARRRLALHVDERNRKRDLRPAAGDAVGEGARLRTGALPLPDPASPPAAALPGRCFGAPCSAVCAPGSTWAAHRRVRRASPGRGCLEAGSGRTAAQPPRLAL